MLSLLPTTLVSELQWYLGNDQDVDNLNQVESVTDRYYHEEINYTEIGDKPPHRILKLIIKRQINLSKFRNLKRLKCSYCKLTELPDGVNQLTHLECDGNQLTRLPDGMNKLTKLM